jgi:hypothetical protein
MSVEILTSEPASFTAGDTVKWTKAIADYPADEWALTYAFQAPDGTRQSTNAAASGTSHAVTINTVASALFSPGVNKWQSYATNLLDSERVSVECGAVTVKPNLAAAVVESSYKQALDAAEAAYIGLIGKKFASTSVNGQTYNFKNSAELLEEIRRLKALVNAENAATAGNKTSNVRVRFRGAF